MDGELSDCGQAKSDDICICALHAQAKFELAFPILFALLPWLGRTT